MEKSSFVLCRWEGRVWPAKVISSPGWNLRRKDIEVEILGEEKRVRIAEQETWQLTQDSVDSLSCQLAEVARKAQPLEELRYRKALRLALNIVSADGSQSSPPGGSLRRSSRLNPMSIAPFCLTPSLSPPAMPKMAAQPTPKARSAPGGQRIAAGSSGSAGEGGCKGRNQPLRLQRGAKARNGHASSTPLPSKSRLSSLRNRKSKKSSPSQSPPSRGEHQRGVSMEESHSDLAGCDSGEATPAAMTTPTASPTSLWPSQQASSSSPAAEAMAALPSPVSTPRRRPRLLRKHLLCSTPDHPAPHSSVSPESAPAEELTQGVESEVKQRRRNSRNQAGGPRQGRGQLTGRRGQRKRRSSDSPPPAKCRKGGHVEVEQTAATQANVSATQPPARLRARFEPADESPDETSKSSDLSIELSFPEDSIPLESSFLQEEDEDEDEELPSFLLQLEKKPRSITEGMCVWGKLRNFPFWPAWVKSVNRKRKKASVVFIDLLLDKKSRKGICMSLRTLKPFDCEEMDELVVKAREKYDTAISWCLKLIDDYRIRIGSGSFSGSFLDYFAHDISGPVRKMCMPGGAPVTFPCQLEEEEMEGTGVATDEQALDSSIESDQQLCRRMPSRDKAARDRANQKLVHFITKKRGPEEHLLAVISGRQSSTYVRSFLTSRQSVWVLYLEDDVQVDQVFRYLLQVYKTAPCVAPSLAKVDEVRFVMDVLLPEAIIRAIAEVDKLSLKQAEDKFLWGSCKSEREREEFDRMIELQTKSEAKNRRLIEEELS